MHVWCSSLIPMFFLLGGIAVTSVGVMTTADTYLHDADVTNLHFHGAFVSSNAPSDDVLAAVPAGGTYQYEVDIPADHMPGTLPALLDNMTDVTWVVQHFRAELEDIAVIMGYIVFSMSPPSSFWLVSGLSAPVISMHTGVWQRWRFVHAGWTRDSLSVSMPSCEMAFLAKDGIYIRDFPRVVSSTHVPAEGRADVVVRCGTADIHDIWESRNILARANVVEAGAWICPRSNLRASATGN